MISKIRTSSGDLYFTPAKLEEKKINPVVARENLLLARKILNRSDIRWGLVYGTLLGAVREHDFIKHDTDTDLFVFQEDKQSLLDILPQFLNSGFKIARHERVLLSVIRGGEYIDFYFFRTSPRGRRAGDLFIPRKFFCPFGEVSFLGINFPTLSNPPDFLQYVYGFNWTQSLEEGGKAEPEPPLWKKIIKALLPVASDWIGRKRNKR